MHFLYGSAEHLAQGLCHIFECPFCRNITTQWPGRHNRGDGQHFEQLLLKFMEGIKTYFWKDLIWRWEWRRLETESNMIQG